MKIRIALGILTALAVMLTAGAGFADSELHGEDWLRGKHSGDGAVLLGHKVYHLGAQTQIRGLKGERLSLDDLIWVPELESLAKEPRVPTLWVEFDATLVGNRLVLNWIQLSANKEGMDRTQLPASVDRYGRTQDGR